MCDKQTYFILPREYYEVRQRISRRFEENLLALALHERECKRNALRH